MEEQFTWEDSNYESLPSSYGPSSFEKLENNKCFCQHEIEKQHDQYRQLQDFQNFQVDNQEESHANEIGNLITSYCQSSNQVQLQDNQFKNDVRSYAVDLDSHYDNKEVEYQEFCSASNFINIEPHSQDIYQVNYQLKKEVHSQVISQENQQINDEIHSQVNNQENHLNYNEAGMQDIKQLDNQFSNEFNFESDIQDHQQVQNEVNNQVQNLQNNYQKNQQISKPRNKNAQYGKNSAKQLGNYLRKHIRKQKMTNKPQLTKFADKKERNKQANYTLEDWREMLLEQNEFQTQCQEFVSDYLKICAYVDIVLEYKQESPEEMIEHIEHFCRGCMDPEKFICNKRNQ